MLCLYKCLCEIFTIHMHGYQCMLMCFSLCDCNLNAHTWGSQTMRALFFLSGFSYTTIHKSQDCRGRGGGGEGGISLTPHYHFYTLYRHLHISQAITAESSPLHIASSWTRSKNLWLLSTSCKPLNYAPLKGLTLERAHSSLSFIFPAIRKKV